MHFVDHPSVAAAAVGPGSLVAASGSAAHNLGMAEQRAHRIRFAETPRSHTAYQIDVDGEVHDLTARRALHKHSLAGDQAG